MKFNLWTLIVGILLFSIIIITGIVAIVLKADNLLNDVYSSIISMIAGIGIGYGLYNIKNKKDGE